MDIHSRSVLLLTMHPTTMVTDWYQSVCTHSVSEVAGYILEVARQRYAPDSYRDFIGFQVDLPLLDQAFRETYGLELKSVLPDESRAIGPYRHDVSKLIPKATRIAWTHRLSKNLSISLIDE